MILEGPERADFANVRALNREFVRILITDPGPLGLDEALRRRVRTLGRRQREWLSSVPFLLFSIYEDDQDRWQRMLADEPQPDLFTGRAEQGAVQELAAAAAGFLWQLSRQNAHAARMVSGASVWWCARIAAATYFELLSRVRRQRQPITARQAAGANIWERLLGPGISSESDIRGAAHIAALQTVLTTGTQSTADNWAVAACSAETPQLRVAEKRVKTEKN